MNPSNLCLSPSSPQTLLSTRLVEAEINLVLTNDLTVALDDKDRLLSLTERLTDIKIPFNLILIKSDTARCLLYFHICNSLWRDGDYGPLRAFYSQISVVSFPHNTNEEIEFVRTLGNMLLAWMTTGCPSQFQSFLGWAGADHEASNREDEVGTWQGELTGYDLMIVVIRTVIGPLSQFSVGAQVMLLNLAVWVSGDSD